MDNTANNEYVCNATCTLQIKDKLGNFVSYIFYVNDFVQSEGYYSYTGIPGNGRWSKIGNLSDAPEDEIFYKCDVSNHNFMCSQTYYYIDKVSFLKFFRPFNHKHLAAIKFETIEEMNEWLKDKKIDSIKDIKGIDNGFLVTYIDLGDDLYY